MFDLIKSYYRPYAKMADMHFNIVLYAFSLVLLASFKVKYSFAF